MTIRSRQRVVREILDWYQAAARDLPWRRAEASAWSVMVSEFMLQQTPVIRVLDPWHRWLERWPTPAALADAPSGEAVRAWGRLGYPRRALRLHAAATVIRDDHHDRVPDDYETLIALPGVGSYTAAAIASFAYGRRHLVLDTNVRRVLTRIALGAAFPAAATTAAERRLAEEFLPGRADRAARWAVASMEFGALVCTARSPACSDCPVRTHCRWHRAGHPTWDGPPRVGQRYQGTDRQCRGALLAVLRASDDPIPREDLYAVWPERAQAERALDSLITDGLARPLDPDHIVLPG